MTLVQYMDHLIEYPSLILKARRFLEPGKTYNVTKTTKYSYGTYYYLKEVPGKEFSSELFDVLDK